MSELSSDTLGDARAAVPANGGPPALHVGDAGGPKTPLAPATLADTGVDAQVLTNLTLKLAYTVTQFTTDWAARKLCLPLRLVGDLLEQLRYDQSLDMLGQAGPFNARFSMTGRGRERAQRVMEISRYVGPAPVSLEAYTSSLEDQFNHLPQPTPEQVQAAVAEMILPESTVEVSGLAALSRRSLFLHGPPGNGKTTLGHLLHDAVDCGLWIPQCIGVENSIIRVFDQECHELDTTTGPEDITRRVDPRWVRIKRPFIVVGGELTLTALDLIYSESLGYYEAPLHFKANGGTFLLDDFGCQRVEPDKLLNRWIHPLERGVDFLTLQTGQQLAVPFRQMLIVSTNLDPDKVMTPAFMRRMGYRVYLGDAQPKQYVEILRRYAAKCQADLQDTTIDHLLERYRAEKRPLRSCEPRDLIERARDICRFHGQPLALNTKVLDLAWEGYFGNQAPVATEN